MHFSSCIFMLKIFHATCHFMHLATNYSMGAFIEIIWVELTSFFKTFTDACIFGNVHACSDDGLED